MRGFWLQQADGFMIYAAFKLLSGSFDIIKTGSEWFAPYPFIAGASAVATVLFLDFYTRETTEWENQ